MTDAPAETCRKENRRSRGAACGFATVGLLLLLAGCGQATTESDDLRLPVFVGIPPLEFLVEQIGGEHVAVGVLVQPGQDPHTFEPTPQQVRALTKAKLFFRIGMPFEDILLAKITESQQRLTVVDTTRGIERHAMDAACSGHGGPARGEQDDDAHAAGEPDPHVWLSPPLLKIMAANIAEALEQADPPHAQDYRKNLAVLQSRFDAEHEKIGRMLAPYRGRTFYVFHPAFGYFADAYGLRQVAIEARGQSPSPKELQALIEEACRDRVTVVFVQPQSAQQSAEVLAKAIAGRTDTINGLAKDVFQDMDDIAAKLVAAMRDDKGL